MRCLGISALLLLTGCASGVSMVPIVYQFRDIPDERRIELAYSNETDEALCLLPEAWPNQEGKLGQASSYVFLIVDDQRFPIEDSMAGHCSPIEACVVFVAPGEEVIASIPYQNFSIPEELMGLPKSIEFSTFAEPCWFPEPEP